MVLMSAGCCFAIAFCVCWWSFVPELWSAHRSYFKENRTYIRLAVPHQLPDSIYPIWRSSWWPAFWCWFLGHMPRGESEQSWDWFLQVQGTCCGHWGVHREHPPSSSCSQACTLDFPMHSACHGRHSPSLWQLLQSKWSSQWCWCLPEVLILCWVLFLDVWMYLRCHHGNGRPWIKARKTLMGSNWQLGLLLRSPLMFELLDENPTVLDLVICCPALLFNSTTKPAFDPVP